ncbi:MAG: SurA N-terminal domain-containing protein [Rhizobiales bacterium]|nr:SurA N-terminal domain-containing protein [Hyphomicrobiales bacterium]
MHSKPRPNPIRAILRPLVAFQTGLFLLVAGAVLYAAEASAQNKIEVAVNNGVVTTFQISQRAGFLKLTGEKGDTASKAREQLIDEELQFQEAKRLNFELPKSAVEEAYGRLAKNNGTTPETFTKALNQRGVSPDTLKRLIHARILWQQIVVARARAEGRGTDTARDVTSILFNRGGNGENRKVTEYTLEQFIFILKKDATQSAAQQRLREVESFRRANATCEQAKTNAVKIAASGVVSKDIGRFTTDTLPPALKSDVEEAGSALFTKPKRRDQGIEIIAICKTRQIVDNTAASGDINLDVGNLDTAELDEKSEKWMKDLRTRALIKRL